MRMLAIGVVLAACRSSQPSAPAAPPAPALVSIARPAAAEVIPQELVVLEGEATGLTEVTLAQGAHRRAFPVVAGRWKAIAQLAPGANHLVVEAAGSAPAARDVVYRPPAIPRTIRMVYVVARDGDGAFDAPPGVPHDLASAVARLRVAGLVLEAATGELMAQAGRDRRSFRIARARTRSPISSGT
ncbi:MAG: hypothetical protein K8W52_12555 [Deltaproteobacteria bacterium]|nr:hypothetical protein [Deltaproteobacteria bacterium]